MDSDATLPRRRSIRLPTYDYSQGGAYFITICAHDRHCLFGRVIDAQMQVNELGAIIEEEWFQSPTVRRIVLDAFVVMPNHVHGIVFIDSVGATGRSPAASSGPRRGSLSSFVGSFKAAATRRIKALSLTPDSPVWQRNYYEHIIRDDKSLDAIREYIDNNPANWASDRQNRDSIKPFRPAAVWEI
jgi:REP element-mobilizing transposase RayT